jgi:hypothetical protein
LKAVLFKTSAKVSTPTAIHTFSASVWTSVNVDRKRVVSVQSTVNANVGGEDGVVVEDDEDSVFVVEEGAVVLEDGAVVVEDGAVVVGGFIFDAPCTQSTSDSLMVSP